MIIQGDCLQALKGLESNSVDSIVTDPPSGIGFMGLAWDHDKGGKYAWIRWLSSVMTEAFRVLKPGGHVLVWSLPRTSHWTADAIELAGFEIRDRVFELRSRGGDWEAFFDNMSVDQLEAFARLVDDGRDVAHIFGSGMAHCVDIGKEIDRILGAKRETVKYKARAASSGTCCNVNDTRPYIEEARRVGYHEAPGPVPVTPEAEKWSGWRSGLRPSVEPWLLARKPIAEDSIARNVLKYGTGALNVDGCRVGDEVLPEARAGQAVIGTFQRGEMITPERVGRYPTHLVIDEAAAESLGEQAKYFYCPKPSRKEKEAGLDGLETRIMARTNPGGMENDPRWAPVEVKNDHPTAKSISLMRYLVKLITPPGGTVLDMFAGSGTTGIAAMLEGCKCVLIEMDPHFCEIIRARVAHYEKEMK